MQNDSIEMEIGGTLQQRISNCLLVMDVFLRQKEAAIVSSIVVAEKKGGWGGADNIVDAVANILGKFSLILLYRREQKQNYKKNGFCHFFIANSFKYNSLKFQAPKQFLEEPKLSEIV